MRNIFYIDDFKFKESSVYQDFMIKNTGKGNLKIRAYAASEALPVSGLKIVVSTEIEDGKIIFFEGETDTSGMIETLTLPTPSLDLSNLEVPPTITYRITATMNMFSPQEFLVKMYDGICVVQTINFVPGGQNVS